MKKVKKVKPFSFKELSNQEMSNLLDEDLPINLKYNEDLVNRVYDRYPIIKKYEIALIIKSIFQSIRELLVLGKILNFHNLFFDTKLLFFEHKENGKIYPSLKVQISTPPTMRKLR